MSFFKSRAYHVAVCLMSVLLIALWFLPYKFTGSGGPFIDPSQPQTAMMGYYTIFNMASYGFGVSLRGSDVSTIVTFVVFLVNIWIFLFTLVRVFKPQWVRRGLAWQPMLALLNIALFGFLIWANNVYLAGLGENYIVNSSYTSFSYVFLGLSAFIALVECIRLFFIYKKTA